MNRIPLRGWWWMTAAVLLALAVPAESFGADKDARRPNIVFLLADDLGYGDLSCFGQERFRTPNIDSIAKEGMRLTQHYSGNAVCAPSRSVLMSGLHPGHTYIRNNRSIYEDGKRVEGQWPIPADAVTIPKLLQKQGYVCGGFGKWGLGAPDSAGTPLKQGLDRFFGYNCQGVAHNFYPTYLWDNDRRLALNNPEFSSRQKAPPGADLNDPATYEQYQGNQYAPDLISAQAVKFIEDNKDRPFFLYYPTTVPHLALQVPDDSLNEFKGKFPETPYDGSRGYLPHQHPRAAYAAMITRMDREVGRMLDALRKHGLMENTIVVFSSDNGPLYDELGGTDAEFFNSARHLRGRKGSLYEGGVRVPTVVSWQGHIPAGTTSDRMSGFEDWLATLLDLAGAKESIPADTDGISMAPTLLGKEQPPRPFLYREFPAYGGQQALWMGEWKGVRQNLLAKGKKTPNLRIELYNLASDESETTNVADKHPEIVEKMERVMREERVPSADFPFPALDQLTRTAAK